SDAKRGDGAIGRWLVAQRNERRRSCRPRCHGSSVTEVQWRTSPGGSMSTITSLSERRTRGDVEWQQRVDLAAAFRLAADLGWHEAVANHFSLAVSPDGKKFLMNPRWRHFSRIKASELLLLDADDRETMNRLDAPDPTAWCIHGHIHAAVPQARCILHVHPPY